MADVCMKFLRNGIKHRLNIVDADDNDDNANVEN